MFYSKELSHLSIFLASNSDTKDLPKLPFMSQNYLPRSRGAPQN